MILVLAQITGCFLLRKYDQNIAEYACLAVNDSSVSLDSFQSYAIFKISVSFKHNEFEVKCSQMASSVILHIYQVFPAPSLQ